MVFVICLRKSFGIVLMRLLLRMIILGEIKWMSEIVV